MADVMAEIEWRGDFTDAELERVHAAAFERPERDESDWRSIVERHSLGWCTARVEYNNGHFGSLFFCSRNTLVHNRVGIGHV